MTTRPGLVSMADRGAPPARTVMGVPFAPGRTVVIFWGTPPREIDDVARLGHGQRLLHPAKGRGAGPVPDTTRGDEPLTRLCCRTRREQDCRDEAGTVPCIH